MTNKPLTTAEHPINPKTLATIEAGLRKGLRLHAFRSGGGLRVVRLDEEGYGEHYAVEVALDHAAESHLEGYSYEDQYGENGLYTCYLTGSSSANSPLDYWLLRGQTFDAYVDYDLKDIVFELKGYEFTPYPEDLLDRAKAGETLLWEHRGFTYELAPSSGGGCTMRVIKGSPKNGADSSMYPIIKRGRASTLAEALAIALEAPAEETSDD